MQRVLFNFLEISTLYPSLNTKRLPSIVNSMDFLYFSLAFPDLFEPIHPILKVKTALNILRIVNIQFESPMHKQVVYYYYFYYKTRTFYFF